MRIVVGFFLLCMALQSSAQLDIIPKPVEVKVQKGTLTLYLPIEFHYTGTVANDFGVAFFKEYLQTYYGINDFSTGASDQQFTPTKIVVDVDPNYINEGYELKIDEKGISIKGSETGLFYGFQTLIQLLPTFSGTSAIRYNLPYCTIRDYPRFKYRGMHLDVSRHFFPVSFIKKYIDYLALHKLNTFHWHLTDDQGWRIEIKKYPRLTSVGGYRNGTIIGRYPGTGNDGIRYGGFYTQEEVKEVVKYAAERFITVMPEIEMPGHASAAIAAYPELSCFPEKSTYSEYPPRCAWYGDTTGKQVVQTWGVFDDVFCAGKENTFNFLQDVMDEVLPLFPSQIIHVGGDECPKTHWKKCPLCQKRMKDNNLKDEHELQSYFIQRMEKYLNSKGKTLMGWDEILEGGLAPNAMVMSWRGEEGGIAAARQKHNVVMTPGNPVYFDHTQSESEDSVTIGGYNPIEKVYAWDPQPKVLTPAEQKYILGAQANLWCEYNKNTRKVEYMIFPRMSALSEVVWSPKASRNWKDFEKRIPTQLNRYDMWKANYSTAMFDIKATVVPSKTNTGVVWQIRSRSKAATCNGCWIDVKEGSAQKSSAKNDTLVLVPVTQSTTLSAAQVFTDSRGKTVEQPFYFNKATGKKITLAKPSSTKYPGDGAFTLVNGIQNTVGMKRSKEFLGFDGTDCIATIDLGKATDLTTVTAHVLDDKGSWIWYPSNLTVATSGDGKTFKAGVGSVAKDATDKIVYTFSKPVKSRFVRVTVKNQGIIPPGNPGEGNKPWLFVDEIEVN